MEITSELLAAYAEGNVSVSERNDVRQYLTEHPEQLETVLMMMDKDYELDLRDETDATNDVTASREDSFSDIRNQTSSFASRICPKDNMIESSEHANKRSFQQRLGDLLDELDL